MHPEPERLRQAPFFEGLDADELERIASWLDVEEHAAGALLTHEGRASYAFFILESGDARVEQDGAELRRLGPGDVFGEIAMLGDGRRSADVVAVDDVRIYSMFGTRFREMQKAMPEVAARLRELAESRTGPDGPA
jgi:CRP/FNR family transcriptional regulator, cyclic AMP receptor protein